MDESTDVAGLAILLVLIRCIYNFKTEEDLLFCKPFKTHTKGKDIFLLVESFLRSMICHGKTVRVYVQMELQRWWVNIQELWLT